MSATDYYPHAAYPGVSRRSMTATDYGHRAIMMLRILVGVSDE